MDQLHKFNHVPSLPFMCFIRLKREIPIQAHREELCSGKWREDVWLCVYVCVYGRVKCVVYAYHVQSNRLFIHHLSSLFLIFLLLLILL